MPEENKETNKKDAFTLHIDPAKTPVEKSHKKTLKEDFVPVKQKGDKKGDKIWNFLRFSSTAAIIFIVLFFVMNWNAYSTIIFNKIGFLKPSAEFIEELEEYYLDPSPHVPNEEQDMMELSKDPEVQKKQIPELALDVTPPDTR